MSNCPECKKNLYSGATSCSCGWGSRGATRSAPPTIMQALIEEITRIGMRKFGGLPVSTSQDMARYWITHNSPAIEHFESPREVATAAKEGVRWICPYHERLIGTLRAFALMGPADRRIVLAGIETEHVWWRGEQTKAYLNIIDETNQMRSIGIAAYRERAIEKMKSFVAKKVIHDPEAEAERAAIQNEYA